MAQPAIETTIKQTRLEVISDEIRLTYEKQFGDAVALGGLLMVEAINKIQSEIAGKAKTRVDTEKSAADELAKKEAAGRTALETHASDLFSEHVAKAVEAGFMNLQTAGDLVCRLSKADGKFVVTTTLGGLQKLGSNGNGTGRSGPRNHKITVDGKQFDTVSQAWKEVMGSVPQPTQQVGGKDSKTRAAALDGFKAAGKVVAD